MKLTFFIFIAFLLGGCQNKTYYFDCAGKEWSVFRSLSSNKEDISRTLFQDASYHILLEKNFLEYKLDGISCEKKGDKLIQCGNIQCFSNFSTVSKAHSCKKDSWMYTSFNLISGDYYQHLYFPNLEKDEYNINSYSFQCKRVKNALDD